jgi:hypothetical protein
VVGRHTCGIALKRALHVVLHDPNTAADAPLLLCFLLLYRLGLLLLEGLVSPVAAARW